MPAQAALSGIELNFNGDFAANYAVRTSVNGGADATLTSYASISISGDASDPKLLVAHIGNRADTRKVVIIHQVGSPAVATAPGRRETVGTWGNTANQITTIRFTGTGPNDFPIGTRLTVYGPAN